MRTNAQFDDAWRRLQRARRIDELEEIINATEQLLHAARMMRLSEKQPEEDREDSVPLDPRLRNKA